jgi:myo-inositol 2-dehydrogenase / D-chiro-inositol 1-dehydrogenase
MKFSAAQRISRRGFLAQSLAAGAAFMIVPRRLLGGPGHTPPSEELTKAVIGVGGMGQGHLGYPDARLLAICDVDELHLTNTLKKCPDAKGYRDFREVLARPDIDIVHIATPPHWHALISLMAAQAGKDIWCEKPMTRTLGEGRRVVEAVRRNSRIFRINTWFRFQGDFYDFGSTVKPIKKLVASGLLGWPLKVTVSGATGFNWKFGWHGITHLTPQPVPANLDYNFWLGPAPFKPYHPHRVHGTFRGYWDYDSGGLGDMGQHYLDPVQYILGKDDTSPVEVSVDAPFQDPDAAGTFRRIGLKYADGCEIVLDADGRGKIPYIEGPAGKLFRGMECTVPGWKRKLETLPDPEPQATDFPECVRTRRAFALNERNGFRSCMLIHLAVAAWRLGRGFRFDPVALRAIDDEGVNRIFEQPMRAPWHL